MFWLGLIATVCYVPGYTGAFIPTQWPVLAVVLWCGLTRKGPFTGWHWAGLAFIAYATVHAFFTPTPYASVYGLWLVWIMGAAVWFGSTMDWTDMRQLYAGLAVGAAVSSGLAVSQFFGVNFPARVSDLPAGMFANSVQLGTVLALVVVALVSERMWLWALPLLPGIALSGSRGAWVALAVGLFGCRVRRVWIFGLFVAAGALYTLLPLGRSDVERMLIWEVAVKGLTFFGWGPGVFYTILIPKNGTWFYPEHAHNDALQLAFEYGIGCLPVLALFVFSLRRTEDRGWPVILAFVTAGCYSMPLFMPAASFLTLLVLGRGLRCHAVAGGYVDNGRQHFLPWRRLRDAFSGGDVPVPQGNPAKG